MANSKAVQRGRRSEKLWLPSLLLLMGQFLTITPALLVVFADEQQRTASDGYTTLHDALDGLSSALAELENTPLPQRDGVSPAASGAAWQQVYSNYRDQLNRALTSSAQAPQIHETLTRADSFVDKMAKAQSAAAFRQDGRAARSELSNAERSVHLQLSTTGNSIERLNTYLKALVGGACLLAFGVVFLVRKFRIDAAVQRELQQELRTINEEVVTALAATRSESEAKNQFLAHIGNLMRTPLNSIVGGTGELLQTELTSQQRDRAQTALELAESLSRVAGQVADYAKMESGGLALESIEFEPAKIVTEVVEVFKAPAERKGLKLKNPSGKALPAAVKGDPERLRQVLVNLISNAVRHTEHGDIWLRAEEVAGTEGRTSLRFEVKDTGAGITEQVRDHIFQPFSQIGGPRAEANQGTGLGLPISKKLVELMGGKIDVSSEPGRGSAFSFTAVFESVRAGSERPRESTQPASPTTAAATASAPSQNGKKGRERRAEPRQGTNYPTLLRSEQAGVAIIRVLDVSPGGLRVSVPFRLAIGSEVEIRIEGASVVGIVRNCTSIRANEFHVGIQIPPATASDEQFLHHLRLSRS